MNDKLDIKPLISIRNFLAEIIQNAKNDYKKDEAGKKVKTEEKMTAYSWEVKKRSKLWK